MSGNEIREMFLRFFEGKGHRRVRSSSLVPHGDPTLLFTNAGMNQFKDVFLGLEKRDYNRATTAQKCVRAGGKHNDLENVGFTKRHHTFFEMMGNFSFGDYFKEKAIPYAWELVTSPDWFSIPKEKLYVTVFGGAEIGGTTSSTGTPACAPDDAGKHSHSGAVTLGVDEDARAFWLKENVPAERVVPVPGLKDNFWAMGDTGPCGPCSEIFYDMGVEASEEGHADCKFPCDCGRYVEIWNLVFMQFNRDATGKLTPLPKPCVDTGMGLERTAAVLQGVISNYDTDLFVPLMKRAAELCGVDFTREEKLEEDKGGAASLRVIADHARATTFLITDGVLPSNEGRGYVLRRIIRRAIDFGRNLGNNKLFFSEMVPTEVGLMEGAYPELGSALPIIQNTIRSEEEKYKRLVIPAEQSLEKFVQKFYRKPPDYGTLITHTLDLDAQSTATVTHYGYGTLGLRLDAIQDWATARKIKLDPQGFVLFESLLDKDRELARASWKGAAKEAASPIYTQIKSFTGNTEKDFYSSTEARDCRIEAIVKAGTSLKKIFAGEEAELILDRTPIYADSGGQAPDSGKVYDPSGNLVLAEIKSAYYPISGLVAHRIIAKSDLQPGDRVTIIADAERRARIMRNHTSTHLVHAALRYILGPHVKQAGSLNGPDRLRFDFSHFAHVDPEELGDIEQQVNDEIRHNTQIETDITSLDSALASGALAFFGDKYPDANVRVVTIPDERAPRGFYSKELCGGTHVHRIGDIGVLKIVTEGSVAAGVRRIEAVTGVGALEHYEIQSRLVSYLANSLNTRPDELLAAVEKMANTVKTLEKELKESRREAASMVTGELKKLIADLENRDIRESRDQVARIASAKGNSQVVLIQDFKVAWSQVSDLDREQLRQILDQLRQQIGRGVVVLASVRADDIALVAGVTKDLTAKVNAGKLIQTLSAKLGGKGGGRPDLAEGSGTDTSALKSALSTIPGLIEPLL